MLYLFSSFDGIIINITTDILNESYKRSKPIRWIFQLNTCYISYNFFYQVNLGTNKFSINFVVRDGKNDVGVLLGKIWFQIYQHVLRKNLSAYS
jgi:hypothetical protein